MSYQFVEASKYSITVKISGNGSVIYLTKLILILEQYQSFNFGSIASSNTMILFY